MVIDLRRCICCGTCVVACETEHCTPPGVFLTKLLVKEFGSYPSSGRAVVPLLCNHCEEPACVEVCPTGATTKREDGIVVIDHDKCMGCRYCVIACPYGARYFLSSLESYFPGEDRTPSEVLGYAQWQKGVVIKCDFCLEKVESGLRRGLKPGKDPDATPTCVNRCMSQARYFGDLDDPDDEVSRMLSSREGHQLHPEAGTNPSVYYVD